MKIIFTLALASAVLAANAPARADVIDAKFSGSVQSQSGTAWAVNAPISGEFIYDTSSSRYLAFTVGGLSVAAGFSSAATVTPDQYTALYTAQLSPVTGGASNSTFTVDLEGLNKWASFDAVALLGSGNPLLANLDTSNSSFGYYTANADGSNIKRVSASLLGLSVSAVPEPASLPLLAAGGLVLGCWLRLRVKPRR